LPAGEPPQGRTEWLHKLQNLREVRNPQWDHEGDSGRGG
jgi:hypothetical protein